MNRLINLLPGHLDRDLVLCEDFGVAYQADMKAHRVRYDVAYLDNNLGRYEGSEIATVVNAGRCSLLARHLDPGASVLDIGAGSGAFVKAALDAGFAAKGFEIIPAAAHALQLGEIYDHHAGRYDAVTMWDSMEHMVDPSHWLVSIERAGVMLFLSVPIFKDLRCIRGSKHYRPGEHLYYWTDQGLASWIGHYGFDMIERSSHETDAGREAIGAYAFRRNNKPVGDIGRWLN